MSGLAAAGPGWRSLPLPAAALALLAAGVAYLAAGAGAALGAAAGALVAAGYTWSFLGSHLARTRRGGGLDSALARGAFGRLALVAAVGYGMRIVGRPAVMAYLLAFGACFALLVAPQVVALNRRIRSSEPNQRGPSQRGETA